MVGEERWVGESDDDFPWCCDFYCRRGGEMVRVLSLGRSSFFLVFFCNPALFVLGTKSLMQR